MTRVRAITTLMLIAACHRQAAPGAAIVWQWSAPQPAYVGMPAAVGRDVAATYGHSVLVLLDATTGAVRWRADRVGLRDVAPALTSERVFAATDDGVIALARKDGRLLWERSLGDRASTPAVVGDAVIVTTWDGRLVNVDRWSIDLPGPALGPPAIAGGIVVASWDGGVISADVVSGTVRWRHEFNGAGTSAPAAGQGLAVVVGGDHRAHAYDLISGRERWARSMKAAGSPEAPPAIQGDRVAVADRLGHVVVFATESGRRRWSADGQGAVERGGPAFAGDAIVLPLDDGRLLIATRHGRAYRDPPGRVSGVASAGSRIVTATREAAENMLGVWAVH